MANTWQGRFPWENTLDDGYAGTSPVKSFPPNGYGLYRHGGQRVGVDERLFLAGPRRRATTRPCCAPRNPRVSSPDRSFAPGQPGGQLPRKVIKGGSHLCAPNYCLRYRPAARQGETVDTSTSHIGFRCILRP